MRHRTASAFLTGVLLAFLVGASAWGAPGKVTDADALSGLAAVRQATARYHDVNRALADGYEAMSPCVSEPGLGTMGIHFVNLALAFDPAVSAASPEILLYVPTDGGLRLVGVEYFAFDVEQPAPQLFGRPLNGPMIHPGEPIPPHYDLHAWIWQGNRAGIFAEFNPTLGC